MNSADVLELIGKSGARYPYLQIDYERKFYVGVPGVLVLVSAKTRTNPILYYAGEQENLFLVSDLVLTRALTELGAFDVFARVNPDAAARRSELDDIIRAYDPPLNRNQAWASFD